MSGSASLVVPESICGPLSKKRYLVTFHSAQLQFQGPQNFSWSTVNLSKICHLFCAAISRAPKPSDLLSPSELISICQDVSLSKGLRVIRAISLIPPPLNISFIFYSISLIIMCTHFFAGQAQLLYHNHANITGEQKFLLQHLVVSWTHKGNIFPTALFPYPAILSNCLLHQLENTLLTFLKKKLFVGQ